jgi:tetratricopeptide (TPR) repeat protein
MRYFMKRNIICLIILLAVIPAEARTVELMLHPAKSPKPEQKYQFMVKAEDQIDADAAPLYEKAIQSLPGGLKMDEIEQWLKIPPDKLPLKKVQSTLRQLEPALELLERAARCKRCGWPYLYDDELSENLRQHRRLLFILALKVRFQLARGRYDDAIGTVQTGFAMARHLGDDSALVRGMVGIAIASYMCRQIEQFVQRPDAPTLYRALRDLPQPFIDLTKQAEWEEADLKGKVHLLMNRLDRHVAILQCIEAVRLYAAAHEGKFPKRLSDITLVPVPDDPVAHKAFVYTRTGAKAVLEMPALKGITDRDTIRYELNLKE